MRRGEGRLIKKCVVRYLSSKGEIKYATVNVILVLSIKWKSCKSIHNNTLKAFIRATMIKI